MAQGQGQDMRELGRKGGQATVAKYGREHMSEIGKVGFRSLAGRIGCFRKRKAAVKLLHAKGRLQPKPGY